MNEEEPEFLRVARVITQLTASLDAARKDAAEWKEQHENLLAMYRKSETELAALRRPGVWVPVEPTEEMAVAGARCIPGIMNAAARDVSRYVYRAMLAAARGSS